MADTPLLVQPERLLTSRDLRFSWRILVKELQLGHSFVLQHGGLPLARLLPLLSSLPIAPPSDPLGAPLIAELSLTVGTADLAAMAGLTEASFTELGQQRQLPPAVVARLKVLEGMMAQLTTCLASTQISQWFHLPRKELRGRSVISHLAFPWNEGEPSVRLVHQLVLTEVLIRVPLLARPGSGR